MQARCRQDAGRRCRQKIRSMRCDYLSMWMRSAGFEATETEKERNGYRLSSRLMRLRSPDLLRQRQRRRRRETAVEKNGGGEKQRRRKKEKERDGELRIDGDCGVDNRDFFNGNREFMQWVEPLSPLEFICELLELHDLHLSYMICMFCTCRAYSV
ncbi:predicted protein [Arabidopsis lyrata subsp. lyrata]|uniref:Predicted protein n=1 Tax=Arabidopsis lyrata subsp. lyrata TaxID=81972 RepID=D7LP06_ARALL|nr:predicted protein [Arabidopsis lyrata subsp. lyrata]